LKNRAWLVYSGFGGGKFLFTFGLDLDLDLDLSLWTPSKVDTSVSAKRLDSAH
jgi:hypothetical protein